MGIRLLGPLSEGPLSSAVQMPHANFAWCTASVLRSALSAATGRPLHTRPCISCPLHTHILGPHPVHVFEHPHLDPSPPYAGAQTSDLVGGLQRGTHRRTAELDVFRPHQRDGNFICVLRHGLGRRSKTLGNSACTQGSSRCSDGQGVPVPGAHTVHSPAWAGPAVPTPSSASLFPPFSIPRPRAGAAVCASPYSFFLFSFSYLLVPK